MVTGSRGAALVMWFALAACNNAAPPGAMPPGAMPPATMPVGAPGTPAVPGVVGAPGVPPMPAVPAVPAVPAPFAVPAMPTLPALPAVPGAPVAPPAPGAVAGVPASFGVPECDAFAAAACGCSNEAIRSQLCATVTQSFVTWRSAVGMAPIARAAITQGCTEAVRALSPQCGGAAAEAAATSTWDGHDTFVCAGSQTSRISGVTATLTAAPAIRASGNCTLELVDCNITAPVAIQASGNATVTVTGGQLRGSEHAVSASGNAVINVAATTLTGDVSRSGNATVNQ